MANRLGGVETTVQGTEPVGGNVSYDSAEKSNET